MPFEATVISDDSDIDELLFEPNTLPTASKSRSPGAISATAQPKNIISLDESDDDIIISASQQQPLTNKHDTASHNNDDLGRPKSQNSAFDFDDDSFEFSPFKLTQPRAPLPAIPGGAPASTRPFQEPLKPAVSTTSNLPLPPLPPLPLPPISSSPLFVSNPALDESDDCVIMDTPKPDQGTNANIISPLSRFSNPARRLSPLKHNNTLSLPAAPAVSLSPTKTTGQKDPFDFLSSSQSSPARSQVAYPSKTITVENDSDDEIGIVSIRSSQQQQRRLTVNGSSTTTVQSVSAVNASLSTRASSTSFSFRELSKKSYSLGGTTNSTSTKFQFLESDSDEPVATTTTKKRSNYEFLDSDSDEENAFGPMGFQFTELGRSSGNRSHSTSDVYTGCNGQRRPATRAGQTTSELAKIGREQERKRRKFEREQEKLQRAREREARKAEKEKQRELDQVNQGKRMTRDNAIHELVLKCHRSLVEDWAMGEYIMGEISGKRGVGVQQVADNKGLVFSGAQALCVYRKVVAEFDKEEGVFRPIREKMVEESTVIVVCKAEDYAGIVKTEAGLVEHVRAIRGAHGYKKIIYVIEGADQLLRKVRNKMNRSMQSRVRQMMGESSGSTRLRRQQEQYDKEKEEMQHITTEYFESTYITLQVRYQIRVVHTACLADSCEWLVDLLQDLGTEYYKKLRAGASLESDVRVKCGSTRQEEFARALEHVKFVTPGVSGTVSREYGNLYELAKEMRSRAGVGELASLKKGGTSQRIGGSLAESIHLLLTSEDPNMFLSES